MSPTRLKIRAGNPTRASRRALGRSVQNMRKNRRNNVSNEVQKKGRKKAKTTELKRERGMRYRELKKEGNDDKHFNT